MKSDIKLAEIGYMAYREHTGGKSLATGMDIPEFKDLSKEIKEAWRASVAAVRRDIVAPVEGVLAPTCPYCDSTLTPSDFIVGNVDFPDLKTNVIFCRFCTAVLSVCLRPAEKNRVIHPGSSAFSTVAGSGPF